MSEFKIYTASAGSGKTFQLTRHYLELLFKNKDNYKRILAVTFTNKAAGELKERVITELVKISGDNPEESGHFEFLLEFLKNDRVEVQRRARSVLVNILQDYGHFSIGTIDHFFQKVLRSFSKEVGIHSGYNLELNSGIFLNGSVELLMADLDKDPALLKWMGKWVDYKISKDESWNRIENDLKLMGLELLREQLMEVFSSESVEAYNENAISTFAKSTGEIIKGFEGFLKGINTRTRDLLDKHGLKEGDFKGGRNSLVAWMMVIGPEKLTRKRHKEAIDNHELWYRKDLPGPLKEQVISAWSGGLNELLREVNGYLDQNEALYNSADLIRQNLFSMGLSGKIMKYINMFSDRSNSLLINLTAPLLSRIIGDNPSPFIYEKVGTYYKHFMIDEFQDTSSMQWANFLPLIRNSLSEDDFSMVVGDVKQSIFRWRNSNWKLMAETAEKDLKTFGIGRKPLINNWRSREYIIDFNNQFFAKAPQLLIDKVSEEIDKYEGRSNLSSELLSEIYKDSTQEKAVNKPGGYIEVNYQEDEESGEWDARIPQLIEDLQIKYGYQPEDIVFLVRSNKQVSAIVDLLQKYQEDNQVKENCSYKIISSQSYELQNSAAVRCIIWAIRYIIDPDESYFKARLAQEYISLKKRQLADKDYLNIMNLGRSDEVFEELLPPELKEKRKEFRYASCTRVVEELIRILLLQKESKDLPYLMAFRDQVLSITRINDSLDEISLWWNERGKVLTVQMTEQKGSMKVMTIHKAKGLEFKVVIMPYCDWELGGGNSSQLMWVDTSGTEFDKVPLVPLKFGKKLAQSSFSSVYFDEKIQIFLDNLNLIYVAFTRAEDRLYAFCPEKPKRSSYTAGDLLKEVLGVSEGSESSYVLGNSDTFPVKTKDPKKIIVQEMASYQPEPFMEASNLRREFETEQIRHGRVMHEILEHIRSFDDLENAVGRMREKGELSDEEVHQIYKHLSSLLKRPDIADWFSGKYPSFSEKSILVPGKGEFRPDRLIELDDKLIVLDFKFGEPRESHGRQVLGYKHAFEKMDFNSVRAYLLYPESGILQEIS